MLELPEASVIHFSYIIAFFRTEIEALATPARTPELHPWNPWSQKDRAEHTTLSSDLHIHIMHTQ